MDDPSESQLNKELLQQKLCQRLLALHHAYAQKKEHYVAELDVFNMLKAALLDDMENELDEEIEGVAFNNAGTRAVSDSVAGVLHDMDRQDIEGITFKKLEKGSESRWWSIGVAGIILLENLQFWVALARGYDSALVAKSDSRQERLRKTFCRFSERRPPSL